MISWRGAVLAWPSVSDLGCNPPAPGTRRDHELGAGPSGVAAGAGGDGPAAVRPRAHGPTM